MTLQETEERLRQIERMSFDEARRALAELRRDIERARLLGD